MMSDLAPLLLLWAIGKRGSGPRWPSAASPPPSMPMPPMPPGPTAETATPLSDLAQPRIPPAPSKAAPARDKRVITDKFRSMVPDAIPKAKRRYMPMPLMPGATVVTPPAGPPIPTQMDVSVADLQKVLQRKGYKSIKKDGLYGPKTALAWQALARGRRLSPMIERLGPRIARVTQDTFLVLSTP
jgi:hypothetical protein